MCPTHMYQYYSRRSSTTWSSRRAGHYYLSQVQYICMTESSAHVRVAKYFTSWRVACLLSQPHTHICHDLLQYCITALRLLKAQVSHQYAQFMRPFIRPAETENFTRYYLYLRGHVTVIEYCKSGSVWIRTWWNCSHIAQAAKAVCDTTLE